ncbi:DUF7288 family protein [Halovenus sp. HT40]|uniref:DUF7288 family protein n=1 Tax=Halovenus sp. HT40 TaxID=3126691 RepID=UPI00300F213E
MKHRRRGQAYALEGIIGAVIVVSALVLGLQAVDIAPWTGDDERQNTETRAEISDALATAQDGETLREAVTCINETGDPHPDVADPDDGTSGLGDIVGQTIADQYEYRIMLEYPTSGRTTETIDLGPTPVLPESDTVSVSRYVVLSDSDPLYEVDGGQCQSTGVRLDSDDVDFYLDNQDDSEALFRIVKIRVIAW